MWRLVERLLRILLVTTAAVALFVIGAVIVSSLRRAAPPLETQSPPIQASVEVRLTSHGGVSHLFVGQPVVIDVVLLNLAARRARNQVQVDPAGAAAAAEILLDGDETPWEHRLSLSVATPDHITVLKGLDWPSRLLGPIPASAGRRLGLASERATFVLDGPDLADLEPGSYVIRGSLPPGVVAPDHARVVPLTLNLSPAPTYDPDRAIVSLAVAKVATLRREPGAAIEAALTALALDPLQDEALTIIAEAWEEQGDLDRAIQWYERYLETLLDTENDRWAALEAYVDALRQQR